MKTLEFDRAMELVIRVLTSQGEDYVYQRTGGGGGCYYSRQFSTASPTGCAVGEVCRQLEINTIMLDITIVRNGELTFSEKPEGKSCMSPDFKKALAAQGWEFDEAAGNLLREVQSAQDAGMPWQFIADNLTDVNEETDMKYWRNSLWQKFKDTDFTAGGACQCGCEDYDVAASDADNDYLSN